MASSDGRWPFRDRGLDVAWALFAAANLLAMAMFPQWETVPFHFIWVSLTLVYGFRVWRRTGTAWVLVAVMASTALLLWRDVVDQTQPPDELTEVPLMAAMFVVMVWHAQRRLGAMAEVQRVSDDNRRLLDREKRFIQDASHQLRTPITIALGHAELLARQQPDGGEDAHILVEELQRLRRLSDLLLRIVSVEEGRVRAPSLVHLDVMIADTFRRWMTVEPRRWAIGALDSAPTFGDADQLQMAFDELVQNAVTNTEPADGITLEVVAANGSVVVRIADTGSGIPAHELDRIFERFARSDDSAVRSPGGAGLGLSFVKSVVESHGGRVSVMSTHGRGSVFDVSLPIEPPEEPGGTPPDRLASSVTGPEG
jgi:signal transduction histidine kinase